MPDSVNTATASGPVAESDSLDLGTMFKGDLSFSLAMMRQDMVRDQRADGRYHHVMDRSFLSSFLEDTASVQKETGELNVVSHIPYSQPFGNPNSNPVPLK